jgi:hypothetical protein
MFALFAATQEGKDAVFGWWPTALASNQSDEWLFKGALAYGENIIGRVVAELISKTNGRLAFTPALDSFIYSASKMSVSSSGPDGDFLVGSLKAFKGGTQWWKVPMIRGLGDALPSRDGYKSLIGWVSKKNPEAAAEIEAVLATVESTAKDPKAPLDTRLSVLPLLAQNKWDKVQPVVKDLLTTTQPPPRSPC